VAKISRPVLYTAVLGAVAYAVVVLTEPAAPPKKKTVARATRTAATNAAGDGITPEDLAARFPRYEPKRQKDPFTPRVVVAHALPATAAPGAASSALPRGKWVLTGIAAINGAKTALVENGAGDTVFLKAGDGWNGLRVAAIGQESISLVTADGRRTELGFPTPEEEKPALPAGPGGVPTPGGTAPPAGQAPAAPNGAPPSRLATRPQGGANGI
jgi:hypothetical protein